jgi:BASS family bile acid:Na+ symporter
LTPASDGASLSLFTVKAAYFRTTSLLLAIAGGALVPQGHVASGAVRWIIMVMLFLVFLQTKFTKNSIHRSHLLILAANIAMGFSAWGLGGLIGGPQVALALFFAGITPTATAAPVIVGFLKGRVDYAIAAFLLTNLCIAALMPALLPLVLGKATPDVFIHICGTVLLVVFVPMALAWLIRLVYPAASSWPKRTGNLSFLLWVTALFLITSNASHFLRSQANLPGVILLEIGVLSAVVCAANFALGHLLGGREYSREASQVLGQKNTTFTIYLAMTYANPLVALGPTFYVLWHNIWNSWQLHRINSAELESKKVY